MQRGSASSASSSSSTSQRWVSKRMPRDRATEHPIVHREGLTESGTAKGKGIRRIGRGKSVAGNKVKANTSFIHPSSSVTCSVESAVEASAGSDFSSSFSSSSILFQPIVIARRRRGVASRQPKCLADDVDWLRRKTHSSRT